MTASDRSKAHDALVPTIARRGQVSIRGGRLKLSGTGAVAVVGTTPLILGRAPTCDLVIDDPGVSAVHAELVATEAGVRIRDLGSRNGTIVDRVGVKEGMLTTRHRIGMGESVVVFEPTAPTTMRRSKMAAFGALVGSSEPMRAVFEQLARVAPTDLSVLVLGETGTGKERVAQAIHSESARRGRALVVVDCGAIPESLAESTLFGHEKGAFTGADVKRISPFEEAAGGTVFLDELGELPLAIQTKLLRVLAERRVKAVGSNVFRPVSCRVVAATRRDLTRAVNEGNFRSDLFFRIAQVRIELPPLRERVEDLPLLVARILSELGDPNALDRVPTSTFERLMRHDWPGNVRELRNAVEVAFALADEGPIEIDRYLSEAGSVSGVDSVRGASPVVGYHDAKRGALIRFERDYFATLIARHGSNITRLAELTGLARPHVRRYLRAHGLKTS